MLRQIPPGKHQQVATNQYVVFDEKSKSGLGFEIGLQQQSYDNVPMPNWRAIQMYSWIGHQKQSQQI